jgi:transcriptional regulator with XRE-family HTH domain
VLTHAGDDVQPHAGADPTRALCDEEPTTLDLNAVVSFNVRAIRLVRGLTQDQVADRLAVFTGHRLPQASISQMERAFVDRKRRRLFNAHDLYLLSKVFEVPIVYFFLPPPNCLERTITNTGEAATAVLDALLGTPESLRVVDSRLVELAHRPVDLGVYGCQPIQLPHVDCNARLREVEALLRELIELHRGAGSVATLGKHRSHT